MKVQKKDKDGKPMFDDKGQPVMEEGTPGLDPTDMAKKMDEITAKQAELEKNVVAQTERANRAEALLQSYVQGGGNNPNPSNQPPAPENPYARAGIDPSKLITEPEKVLGQVIQTAVSEATKIMEKRYHEAESMKAQMEGIRTKFYKDNPDLVGFEKIVGFAEEGMRVQYPNTPYVQLLTLIATEARKEVVALKAKFGGGSGGNPPLSLENGGGSNQPPPPNPDPNKKSEGDEFKDYMDGRKAHLTKTRLG